MAAAAAHIDAARTLDSAAYGDGLTLRQWRRLARSNRHLTVTVGDPLDPVAVAVVANSRGGRPAELLRLAVREDSRGGGVGRGLVAVVGAERRLRLRLRETNRDALEFAVRVGFRVRRVVRDGFGEGTDAVILERPAGGGSGHNSDGEDD